MADFPGFLSDYGPFPMSPAPLPHTGGKVTVTGARRRQPVAAYVEDDVGEGVFLTAGGITPPPPSGVLQFAEVQDTTPGVPWFDHVHILPREPGINFGNIITTVQGTFELFNAYRQSVVLTTFVNNAGAGVSIPDLPSLPFVMGAFSSILSPLSTRLNPVPLAVEATPEGPAQFNATLDFTFAPGGLLMLRVQGSRIALVSFDYEQDFDEELDFGGQVLERFNGTEQRIAERGSFPVQIFEMRCLLDERDKQRLKVLLFGWQSRQFALALRHERMFITAPVSSGFVVSVDSTTDVDLRVGGLATLLKSNEVFDVLTVASKTATTITFVSAIQQSFDIGDLVMPVRLTNGPPIVRGGRPPVNLEEFRMRFVVLDNHTGALTGDVSAFSSLNSLVLLDDCNLIDGSIAIERRIRVVGIDNQVGVPFQEPVWDVNKRSHPKTFLASSRAELIDIRRLLIELRGTQTPFYIPTFDDDLTVTQNIASGGSTMTVQNVGYTRFAQSREPFATFIITFDDGSSLARTITSSIELSVDEEELTLNTTWGVNKTVAEVVRVEFVELVRMATPRVRIQHQRIGLARVSMPLVAVFETP